MRGKAAERVRPTEEPAPSAEQPAAAGSGAEQTIAPGDNNLSGGAQAAETTGEAAQAAAEPQLDLRHVEVSPELVLEAKAIAEDMTGELLGVVEQHFATAVAALSQEQRDVVGDAFDAVTNKWALECVRAAITATAPPPIEGPTLRGDLRDGMLHVVKGLPRLWGHMSEGEQQALIRDCRTASDNLFRQAVREAASRGFDNIVITISKFTCDAEKGIQATFGMSRNGDNLVAIGEILGTPVLLVPVEEDEFMGERGPAEPDVVGELRMPKNGAPTSSKPAEAAPPTSGPGTPTDPETLAKLGRGDTAEGNGNQPAAEQG